MKNFIDTETGQIYSYELDGSQDFVIYQANNDGTLTDKFINPNLKGPLSEEEYAELRKPSTDALAASARNRRDALLALYDAAINIVEDDGGSTADLRAVRVALRHIPEQAGFPSVINWPELPTGVALSETIRDAVAGLMEGI